MSDKKKCPFCEAIALQRFIEEHHSKPAGFGMALSAALVSYAVLNAARRWTEVLTISLCNLIYDLRIREKEE